VGADASAGAGRRDGDGGSAMAVAARAGRLLARGVPRGRYRRGGRPQAVRGDRRPAWDPAGTGCAAAPRREVATPRTRRRPLPARGPGSPTGRPRAVPLGPCPAPFTEAG